MIANNWKLSRCPSIREWLIKLWYMNVMAYYYMVGNDMCNEHEEAWKDLYELTQTESK